MDTKTSGRQILHIDFDSFFASCEQQFNPKLRGKPMGVTARNGRTCIIASSREAKALGIKTGTRSWEAYKICPDLVLVPANFEKYWEISKKFLDICKDYSPYVELFSLDEVFMDITSTRNLFGGPDEGGRLPDRGGPDEGGRLPASPKLQRGEPDRGGPDEIIRLIKQRIHNEIGEYITVSVGISHNKLLAKLASGLKKPNGIFEIKPEDVEKIYKESELTDLCGIGERIKRRLNKIGIFTLSQLSEAPLSVLIKEFKDVEGHFLYSLGKAEDNSPVVPYYRPTDVKSVGRNYCLPQNTYDQRIIMQNIFELCEEIGIKLRRLGKKAKTIGIYLSGDRGYHGRKTLHEHIDKGIDLFSVCKIILKDQGFQKGMVRQMSVWAGNLEDSKNLTPSLFDRSWKNDKVQQTIDSLNDRFGDHTLIRGSLLYGPNLHTVPNGWGADRYERKKLFEEGQAKGLAL